METGTCHGTRHWVSFGVSPLWNGGGDTGSELTQFRFSYP